MIRKLFTATAAASLCFSINAMATTNNIQPQIQQYITEMVQQHHFNKTELEALFANFKPNEKIITSMNRPYEAKPWATYRKFFIKDSRIEGGVAYWQAHKKELQIAEKKYGVPASVIVAILGVESSYGKHRGTYSVFDSLATLAFAYPKRAKFFRSELTNYLLLSHEQQFPVMEAKGSYAGAMGMMQFMPSNVRKYGVGNLRHQVFNKDKSAILSIANFLHSKGWKYQQPVATALTTKHVNPSWITANVKKFYSIAAIKQAGITPPSSVNKAYFINLPQDPTSNTWMVYSNFKAIMSYNPRIPYAMAVYQLSEAIKHKMRQTT